MKAIASAGFGILEVNDGQYLLLLSLPNFKRLQQLGCFAVIMRIEIAASTDSFEFNCVFMVAKNALLLNSLVFMQVSDLEIVVTLVSTLIE